MRRFVEGADRGQTTLLPECLGDWVEESNPVRAVDVFVEALDLANLGFDGVQPLATPPGVDIMDRMIDVQDARDRANQITGNADAGSPPTPPKQSRAPSS